MKLFIISTPSQAFFLSQTLEVTSNSVLILTVKSKKEANKILYYLEGLHWKEINIWLVPYADDKVVYYKLFLLRIRIITLKFKFPTFSKIYFGSYANIIHLSVIAAYEPKTKLILLYDGLQMVSVNHFRNRLSTENNKKFPRAYKLLGFKEPKIKKLTYSSPLKLIAEGEDKIEIIKRRINPKRQIIDEDIIYFIGQPLPEIGVISSEYYIATLKKLKYTYSKKIIYFPHPREGDNLIREISKIFEIKIPETIFEEYFLNLQTIPCEVISFYSSVLVNLVFLNAPSKITSVGIPENEIRGARFIRITSTTYEYFNQISNGDFQVINPKNL